MLKTIAVASIAGMLSSSNGQIIENVSRIHKNEVSYIDKYNDEEIVSLDNEGKFDYHYSPETGPQIQATFWQWSFGSEGISNNEELLESYSQMLPYANGQRYTPTAYIRSEKWNDSYSLIDPMAFDLSNVKEGRVESIEDFAEKATWFWQAEYKGQYYNQVKWGVSISTYTDDLNRFILQFTTGFDLEIKDDISFDFGGQIAPELKLISAK
ncbi:hypothetical protein CK556_02430 [Mesoplasma chauliocola]|uniref:Uncharacterized protein n=1 Tax=Mesoplasma chauliocola TaxID=216427 RepID=A0A249SNY5_9MOLU|nr:hypothetical protein [Mesoplasma chauliocola]ASZ09201.1 hypothetical protein CK556_02430 [Mesoplasma chauliocola]